MEITPPQAHISLDKVLSAGMFLTSTVGHPGAQGAVVTGTQGAGEKFTGGGRTVAGFAGFEHMPKGGMLTFGLLSMIVATGREEARVAVWEFAAKVEGAAPKLH